jgi:hypothetical protein
LSSRAAALGPAEAPAPASDLFGRITITCDGSHGGCEDTRGGYINVVVPAEARDEVVALVRAIIAG